MASLSSAVVGYFQSFYGSGDCWGGGDGTQEGVGGDDGFFSFFTLFTLHSDQSFLNTPELRDSRIGTHPVRKERETNASE